VRVGVHLCVRVQVCTSVRSCIADVKRTCMYVITCHHN